MEVWWWKLPVLVEGGFGGRVSLGGLREEGMGWVDGWMWYRRVCIVYGGGSAAGLSDGVVCVKCLGDVGEGRDGTDI